MKPIPFSTNQLEVAWDYFYYLCSQERYNYISLIDNKSYDQIWICFSPPRNKYWKLNVLKIHGTI